MTEEAATPGAGVLDRVDVVTRAAGTTEGPPMTRLVHLVGTVRTAGAIEGRSLVWLCLSGLAGGLPTSDEVLACWRALRSAASDDDATVRLLQHGMELVARSGSEPGPVVVAVGQVLVDVHHTATSTLQTGVQRVVRRTAEHWSGHGSCRFVQWREPDRAALLDLAPLARAALDLPPRAVSTAPATVLIPWHSTLVLLESSASGRVDRLAALAEHSGNRVGVVGYDTIPASSAETVTVEESERFASFLSVIKHTHVVAGISESASHEFAAFGRTLSAQGLAGPRVVAVPLPTPRPTTTSSPGPATAMPVVLVVGSHEPRKNHLAVVHAAERLWREGLRFRLRFIGGSGWMSEEFDRLTRRLEATGRDLVVERAVSEADLVEAYQEAWFTTFPSLHEGFGLPVAESLAHGRVVVTSGYGATAEAAGDWAVRVDPRDDDDLLRELRVLLSSPVRPVPDTSGRPPGGLDSWSEYASRLWSELVGVTA